jgi:hypothetical protein
MSVDADDMCEAPSFAFPLSFQPHGQLASVIDTPLQSADSTPVNLLSTSLPSADSGVKKEDTIPISLLRHRRYGKRLRVPLHSTIVW